MVRVLTVYATEYGNTKKMAEVVASGVTSVPDAQVQLKRAEDVTEDDVLKSDAVIIGTPVRMGSVDWRVKKFIDEICTPLWRQDRLVGKVGAVFATGGGYGNAGGGGELTMLAVLNNFAQLGMMIVPLPKNTPGYYLGGLQWGPFGRSAQEKMEPMGVTEERLEAAKHHGANVARVAAALAGKALFAK